MRPQVKPVGVRGPQCTHSLGASLVPLVMYRGYPHLVHSCTPVEYSTSMHHMDDWGIPLDTRIWGCTAGIPCIWGIPTYTLYLGYTTSRIPQIQGYPRCSTAGSIVCTLGGSPLAANGGSIVWHSVYPAVALFWGPANFSPLTGVCSLGSKLAM